MRKSVRRIFKRFCPRLWYDVDISFLKIGNIEVFKFKIFSMKLEASGWLFLLHFFLVFKGKNKKGWNVACHTKVTKNYA